MKASFLQPEPKKLILPAVFIIIFFYLISVFSAVGAVLDNHTPDLLVFINKLDTETQTQNLTLGEVVERLQVGFAPLEADLSSFSIPGLGALISFTRTLDPLIPLPCEISTTPYCRYYMSEESYTALFQAGFTQALLTTTVSPSQFSQPTIIDYIISVVILFVEGYIISAIVLFFYRKRKKEPWHRRIFNVGRS